MRKTPPARRGFLTVTVLVLSAVAAACSSSPGPPSSGGSVTAQATPASTAPAGPAQPGTGVSGTLSNGTIWLAEYPASWNGTLVLYSHGFGSLTAADAPDSQTQSALLAAGYAIAGSSFDPHGSEWALDTALSDQFGALAAVESAVLPRRPAHVLAFGTSMGGLISALEAQDGQGKIDGALTTCGVVSGGVNLSQYQLDGEYAITRLLGDAARRAERRHRLRHRAGALCRRAAGPGVRRRAGQAGAGHGLPQPAGLEPVRLGAGRGERPPGAGGGPGCRADGQRAQRPQLLRRRPGVDRAGGRRAAGLDRRDELRAALRRLVGQGGGHGALPGSQAKPEQRPRRAQRRRHHPRRPGGSAVAAGELRSHREARGARARPAHHRRQPRPGEGRELLRQAGRPGRQRRPAAAGIHRQLRALQLQRVRGARGPRRAVAAGDDRAVGRPGDGGQPGGAGHRAAPRLGPFHQLLPG